MFTIVSFCEEPTTVIQLLKYNILYKNKLGGTETISVLHGGCNGKEIAEANRAFVACTKRADNS
jgi:hypothetical protein